jgi:small subunit ribosomal protein S21
VFPGDSIDGALRRWKKVCERDGVLADLRKREHFTPPGERRRKKSAAARKRLAG